MPANCVTESYGCRIFTSIKQQFMASNNLLYACRGMVASTTLPATQASRFPGSPTASYNKQSNKKERD
jgi:hypothetical protein